MTIPTGAQTSPVPTKGSTEKMNMTKPQKIGEETPIRAKRRPPRIPWMAPTTRVLLRIARAMERNSL